MASQTRTNVKISGALVDNTIVAAVAGYRIRVLSYVLVAANSVTAKFISDSTIEDSYSETNADATLTLYSGAKVEVGQTLNPIVTGSLETAKFVLSKFGAPTGNVTAVLYAHTGTFGTTGTPTGAALATSDTLDVSTLTTSGVLTTLTFTAANRVTLTAGTKYTISIAYAGGDASNYLVIGTDTSSPSHAGNSYYNDGSYHADATTDVPFYVNASSFLTGAMSMVVGQPNIANLEREGHFETVAGEALHLTLSTTVQVSGHMTYDLIEAS